MSYGTTERWVAFLIAALFIAACVFIIGQMTRERAQAKAPAEDLLPSISAIQERLNEMEPESPLRIDGKLGPATQAKWDRLYIEQSAQQAWEEFEIDKSESISMIKP